jgi:hypothetical protein
MYQVKESLLLFFSFVSESTAVACILKVLKEWDHDPKNLATTVTVEEKIKIKTKIKSPT